MRAYSLLFVAVALANTGCSDDEAGQPVDSTEPIDGTWVTRLSGTDAWLGITVKDGAAAAFVCGGEDSLDTHTRWMLASVDTREVTFEQDGWQLIVETTEAQASGELIDPDGAVVQVAAAQAAPATKAGLYFGFDSNCGDGLIVLNSADEDNEALGAWCDDDDNRSQVTPVMPFVLDAKGIEVTADTAIGVRSFFMAPALPASVTP